MKRQRILALTALLLGLLMTPAVAQLSLTTDELYGQARALAFEGKREDARNLCQVILDRSPGYVDARILLGRLYAWDKDYASARRELLIAVDAKPNYVDARLALIDTELWADDPAAALRYANAGLARDPENVDYLARKVRALNKLGRYDEARPLAARIVEIDPDNRSARRSYYGILDKTLLNKISADYEIVTFDDSTENWHLGSFAYRRFTPIGSVIGRVNVARRFNTNGIQFEADAYPTLSRFWDKTYAYVNAGWSPSSLFPKIRVGAEVYHNFPDGWEGSLGFRFLDFKNSNTTIYTGTIAKYIGNYWISLRPNYVPDSLGDSLSATLSVRRFFGSRYEYWEVTAGRGVGDELNNATNQTEQLDSFGVSAQLRKRIKPDVILKGGIGFETEDLTNNRERDSWSFGIGIERYY